MAGMKGVVFTEFLEMVEQRFSLRTADHLIQSADLPSGGVYTSVGTYAPEEMVRLVSELSRTAGEPVPVLLRDFGKHLFHRFAQTMPQFFEDQSSAFDFLKNVEGYIHVEVRKLYPDAELPTFECEVPAADELVMTYRSPRRLSHLAEGLMLGCAEHFGEHIEIRREDLSTGAEEVVRFRLIRSRA